MGTPMSPEPGGFDIAAVCCTVQQTIDGRPA